MSGRVLVVGHTYYPDEPRIRREAEALVSTGCEVTVLCLKRAGTPSFERVDGVQVARLPIQRRRGSPIRYAGEYLVFFLTATWVVLFKYFRHRYDVVQVWNQPDVLVLAGLIPRLLGARLVLDYRDSMPDTFASKYGLDTRRKRAMHNILRALEKFALRAVDHVVTVHEPYRKRAISEGVRADRTSVFLNLPDPSLFDPSKHTARPRPSGRFVLMYHGLIARRFGVDVAIKAVALLRDRYPEVLLRIYGEGDGVQALIEMVKSARLEDHVILEGFKPLKEMPEHILACDVGVVPVRRDPLEDQVLSTKLLEYLAMGRPVIASWRPILEQYLTPGCVLYFESEDAQALAERIERLMKGPEERRALAEAGLRFLSRYPWPEVRAEYVTAMAAMISKPHGVQAS